MAGEFLWVYRICVFQGSCLTHLYVKHVSTLKMIISNGNECIGLGLLIDVSWMQILLKSMWFVRDLFGTILLMPTHCFILGILLWMEMRKWCDEYDRYVICKGYIHRFSFLSCFRSPEASCFQTEQPCMSSPLRTGNTKTLKSTVSMQVCALTTGAEHLSSISFIQCIVFWSVSSCNPTLLFG